MSINQKYLKDENGNIFSPVVSVDSIYDEQGTIFDAIYPIGSVYISVNSTNPSVLFGGTWERIAQGRTLMGEGVVQANSDNWCGTTKAGDWTAYAGGMGGEVFHTLTVNQMPSHTHAHRIVKQTWSLVVNRDATGDLPAGVSPDGVNNGWANYVSGGNCANQNTGGSEAHNNMPPYLVVFIWKRTA